MAARKAEVIITCDGAAAKQVLEGINRELQKAIKEREQLLQKQKQNGTLTQDEIKRDRELKKYIDSLTTAQQKSAQEMKKYADVMKDLAGSKTKDLKKALGEVKRALDNMSARDPKRAQLEQDLRKIQKQIDANTVSINKNKNAWGALGTTMKNLFAYAGIFAGFNMLKSKFEEIIKKNREMSDQLANIRKVSGLAMSDINQLNKNLAKIDTRSSIQELNELSYVGAKLGFGNYGIEGLESFAKSALKVNNALKEDLGEDSMMAISKLVEVMGLIPKMGVEKAMDSAGSAIFKLASTSTATGGNIIEFSKRLMGLANVSHILVPELLGLASASDALGLMPEVSATAFNKVFTSIQSNTKAIEQSLQMQKGELTDLINQGKTMEAIVTVFDKMHGMNMDQLKAQGVFKALGSDGARLNNVMITMADRIDMLKTHLHTSSQAFSEGTAVAQEYAIQMETAEAYMQRAANMWTKAFVNPEGVDLTKEFAKAWYDLSKALTQTEGNATTLKFVMESIFGIMKLLIELLPAIIAGFTTWGLWAGGAFLVKQLKELLTMLTAIGAGVRSISWAGLGGVITGVAMGTYILFQKFRELNGELQKIGPFMQGFKRDMSDLNVQFGAATQELDRYKKAIDKSVQGTKQRAAAIAEFNNKFGGYLKNMLTEESSAYAIARAYDTVTKALRAKMALQMKEKDISDQVMTREAWTAERREEYAKSIQGTQYSQYGRDWITAFAEENRGRRLGDIGKDLAKMFGITAKEVANMIPDLSKDQSMFKNLYTDQQWMVRNALRYIAQDRSARNAKKKVDEKWAPEQKAMEEYLASQTQQETPITPIEGDRPTKEEIRAAKQAEAEYKQMIRKELQDAKQESDAIMSKIEEWYRLQETVVEGFAADGKWTQEYAAQIKDQLEISKNQMLADARLAISGRDTKTWEKSKYSMKMMMFDMGEWSQELFDEMMNVSMASIRSNIAKIDAAGVEGITTASLKDALDKNAAGNLRKIQEIKRKSAKIVEDYLLKYNFLEKAVKAFEGQLDQIGILTETAEEAAERIRKASNPLKATDPEMEKKLARERSAKRRAAGEQFVKQSAQQNYSVDIENTDSLANWLKDFTGAKGGYGMEGMEFQFSGWADAFRDEFNEWLKDAEKYKSDIQAFYISLINYDKDYYKSIKDYRQKMNENFQERWDASGNGQSYKDKLQDISLQNREQQLTGKDKGSNFAQLSGFSNVNEDPEVTASLVRIAQMQKELEEFREVNESKKMMGAELIAFQEEVAERERSIREEEMAMQEALMANINEQISKLQQWTEPIEQFGQDVGDAMGKALFESESMAEGMQNALKSLVKAWGQSTIDIVKQLMMQQLKQKMIDKAMGKEAKASQKEQSEVVEQGSEERFNVVNVIETGITKVVEQAGQERVAAKGAQENTETQQTAHKTIFDVLAGIAQGAAKTIGSLGPWGMALVAVISALLMGLLSTALGALGGGDKSSNDSSSKKKIKLASGMLTYDSGNVQTVVGDDGHVYRAREQASLPEGVKMITSPIATHVNGQQALVGERGPEIVIGRKTTRAIQMNRPDLLRDLALIDRGLTTRKVRTFDDGNIQDLASAIRPTGDGQPAAAIQQTDLTSEDARALTAAIGVFSQTVATLQKNGIPAKIQKYGKGGLIDEVQSGLKFQKRYEG